MTAYLPPMIRFQPLVAGSPLPGGKVYFYQAGTLTPQAAYAADGTTPLANPLTLDANGATDFRLGSGLSYKINLTDSVGGAVLGWPVDQIAGDGAAALLSANLADSSDVAKGDALVAVKQPFTGGVARTQHDKNQETVTPEDFGAVGNGTTDDTTSLQNWATCGVKNKLLPGKTYKVVAGIVLEDGAVVRGCGRSSVIDASAIGASFTGTSVLSSAVGSLSALPNLSVSPAAGALSLTFASAHGLSENDVFIIYNPTNDSFSSHRSITNGGAGEYRAGEFCRVLNVTGSTTVTIWNPLYAGYTFGAVSIYKLAGTKVRIEGVSVKAPKALGTPGILLNRCINPVLNDVESTNSDYAGIQVNQCYGTRITGANPTVNAAASGTQYGAIFANSQEAEVQGNFYGSREGVDCGGSNQTGGVPTRNIRFHDSAIYGANGTTGTALHGNSEDITFDNCRIFNGAGFGGKNQAYRNCVINGGDLGAGVCVYAGEMVSGVFELDNCTFSTQGDPNTTSRGVLDFGGNSTAFNASTNGVCDLIVKACTLKAPNLGVSSPIMRVKNQGSLSKINVSIDGFSIIGSTSNTSGSLLSLDSNSGTYPGIPTTADYIRVEGVTGLATGAYLALASSGHATTPWRIQSQSGASAVNVTAAVNTVLASTVTLKWWYPKVPNASVTRSNSPASTGLSYLGNFMGIAYMHQMDYNYVKPGIATESAALFGGAVNANVLLHWTVGLSEC